mmetsp:Transcript_49894/g.101800  ORF Transcript_49894/g.101800 Transcript_49894/m.101800 type:complete len:242 (+) Transcript_49894:41-766(+)|eukprot:CAMPEP_0181314698 /NCGR_PEP_ID=MMETSP1101-20121128/14960_1 /TAXON_ID=46948 /ORGANISM="Rhodomonas abbreviata, Strain Caron Lab Isolate" /LENGTH=241 /DNA_ID=CAMNT_0023421815 /DNA_START=35 /DNA_END=760 /DNA_ORIENTATION=+
MSSDTPPQGLSLDDVLAEKNLSGVLEHLQAQGVQTVEGLMALSEKAVDELPIKLIQAKKLKSLLKDEANELKLLIKELSPPAAPPPYTRDTPVRDAGWILMKLKTESPENDDGRRVHFSYDIYHRGFMKQFYCGVRAPIPGTDGQCGPSNGPSCASCERFLASELGQDLLPRSEWHSAAGQRLNIGNAFKFRPFDGSDKVYCGGECRDPGTDGTCGRAAGPNCSTCKQFTEEAWAAVEGYQ